MFYRFRFLVRRLPDTSIARGAALLIVACLLLAFTALVHAGGHGAPGYPAGVRGSTVGGQASTVDGLARQIDRSCGPHALSMRSELRSSGGVEQPVAPALL